MWGCEFCENGANGGENGLDRVVHPRQIGCRDELPHPSNLKGQIEDIPQLGRGYQVEETSCEGLRAPGRGTASTWYGASAPGRGDALASRELFLSGRDNSLAWPVSSARGVSSSTMRGEDSLQFLASYSYEHIEVIMGLPECPTFI
ncbi:hypothetical protein Salat_1623600 [Sesamum alatum]|uniref:Uncharacterized protein n=1 Tax=Sesamum alatum TaxID=300844 RepID=A0AAE1Y6L8_9LAMI|nr:hypothetical protein Salat_1623600 [Sesamum alatum]